MFKDNWDTIYKFSFQEYTKSVEEFIEKELEQRIEDFNMKDFIQEIEDRKLDLEGEVFEMLFTLTDFLAFKDMFVSYKIAKTSTSEQPLQEILSITSLWWCVNQNEKSRKVFIFC